MDAHLSFSFEAELALPPLATHKRRTDVVCQYWLRRRCAADKECVQLHIWDEARLPVCKFGEACAAANKFRDVPCLMRHLRDDDKEECVNYRLGFCRCVLREVRRAHARAASGPPAPFAASYARSTH
jgi:hypothetical protein